MTNPMLTTIIVDSISGSLLGALPEQGGYFDIAKIIPFLLAALLWAYTAAWTEADIKQHRLPRGIWAWLILGSGIFSLAVWLLVPVYVVGVILYVVVFGAAFISFAVFRNRRVPPSQTVLTPAHLKRLTGGSGDGGSSEDAAHRKDRVRIKDSEGKAPPWPKDPVEHAAHQALQDLLFDAIWRRSSDLRLDVVPDQPVKIVYKVDGVDRAREPIDAQLGPHLLAQLKQIGGMDPDEHRRPQSGRFEATIGAGGSADKSVEIDVKTSGSTAGQRLLLKLFSEEAKFRIEDLGFTKPQLEIAEKLVREPKGVLIVSGPRGSGLTSTLYAIIRHHDAFMQNIHSLEINKSLELENITQHVYDSQDGTVSFGKRFRSILRTEPDIIMAGDTPDTETAALAAAAGRQGKKIYLGMTAKDTFTALRRYLQGVDDNALAASSLMGVTCQRLTRVVCTECRRAYKPDPSLLKKANLPMGENRPFYRPPNQEELEVDKQGNPILCSVCQGAGYLGRTGVFEILLLDDDLRDHIAKGTPLPTIKVEARKKGMLYLQEVALHKVYEGETSINEVLRVTRDAASSKSKTRAKA